MIYIYKDTFFCQTQICPQQLKIAVFQFRKKSISLQKYLIGSLHRPIKMQQHPAPTRHTQLHLNFEDIETLDTRNFFSRVCTPRVVNPTNITSWNHEPQFAGGDFDLYDFELLLDDAATGKCKEYIESVFALDSEGESCILTIVESMCEQLTLAMYQYIMNNVNTFTLGRCRDAIIYVMDQAMQFRVTKVDVSNTQNEMNQPSCIVVRIEELDFQANFTDLEWEMCRFYFAVAFPRACFPTYNCRVRFETLDDLAGVINNFKAAMEKLIYEASHSEL